MGLLHALSNVSEQCGGYRADSFMHRLTTDYKDDTEKGTPQARGQFLNEDTQLEEVHQIFAKKGQSAMDSNARSHYVTYVNLDGHIWELDGRREAPILKGDCTAETFGEKIGELI